MASDGADPDAALAGALKQFHDDLAHMEVALTNPSAAGGNDAAQSLITSML